MAKCPTCQCPNPDEAKLCTGCGLPLSGSLAPLRDETGERRYVTVMFCDLVDSSSLAEDLGPEDYREVIQAVHESSAAIIEQYGGQVSQYLGDGILVLFGYPVAHEDDATRAVAAALEVQTAIPACGGRIRTRVRTFSRSLHSRAAIHTGLVVIGEMGLGSQRPVLALGDAVNVASRLQNLTAPDTLLITSTTRRLVGEQFDLEPRGAVTVRGIRTPLDTFRVVGFRPAARAHDATRRGELTPMVGRERELALILDRWDRVSAGQGQIVVLSGDAGIGKSRLRLAAKRALSLEDRWVELRGSPYHQSTELRPLLELFENRILEGATGAEGRRRLMKAMDAAELGGHEGLGALASLLALPASDEELPLVLVPEEQRRRILNLLATWVWRLADAAPITVAVEDLQWIDPTSIELLRLLVTNCEDHRVLLLVTCRTPFVPPWDARSNEERLALEPLAPAQARRLVESIAEHHAPPDDVMRDVLAKSDGVPLYLEEVARMLIDVPAAMGSVPESLRELLAARLDRISPQALETTRLGAVIGRHFSLDVLLAVSPKSAAQIQNDLLTLMESGVLERDTDGYSFKHVLLRDTAYERMLRATKSDLHGRVAATLVASFPYVVETQPELIAHHFTEAGATGPALREWKRAGTRSLGNGAYREAVHHFQRALGLSEQLPDPAENLGTVRAQDELRLRKDLGIGLIATQGYTSQAVADNYARALHVSSELNDREEDIPIPVLYGLWGTYLVRGDRGATNEFAKHFRRVLRTKDPLARHVAHATLGARAFYRGEFATSMEHCQKAVASYAPEHHFVLMRDYGYEGGLYSQLYIACLLCFTGFPDRGLDEVNKVLELSKAIGDPYSRAVALGLAACVARERREPGPAEALSADLLKTSTESHFIMWEGIGHCLHGWARVKQGDLEGGTDEIRFGLAIWEATGAKVPGTYLRLSLIEAELARGEPEAGLEAVELGLHQCRTTLEVYQEPEYHRLKGELLKVKGLTDAAEREMRRALRGARRQGATWVEMRAALSLARLRVTGASPADSARPLADVLSRLTEGVDTSELQEANAVLASC